MHHPDTLQCGAGGHDHTYVLLFHGVQKVDGSVVGSTIIEKHNETTLKGERRKKAHICVSVHNRYALDLHGPETSVYKYNQY